MFTLIARVGFVAKGSLYLLMGVLAFLFAVGFGGHPAGSTGALLELGRQPFGKTVLFVVAVGLVCHAIWRFAQSFVDTERVGRGFFGICFRIGCCALGIVYTALAWTAYQIATSRQAGARDDDSERHVARFLLAQPFGRVVLMLVAVGFVVAGLVNLVETVRATFKKHLQLARMGQRMRAFAVRMGRAASLTLATLCFFVATFFFFAARDEHAREARGLGGVMRFLAQQPNGSAMLAIFAGGLMAYGSFQLIEARYRRIR